MLLKKGVNIFFTDVVLYSHYQNALKEWNTKSKIISSQKTHKVN